MLLVEEEEKIRMMKKDRKKQKEELIVNFLLGLSHVKNLPIKVLNSKFQIAIKDFMVQLSDQMYFYSQLKHVSSISLSLISLSFVLMIYKWPGLRE
jgi:hypothetical protein